MRIRGCFKTASMVGNLFALVQYLVEFLIAGGCQRAK